MELTKIYFVQHSYYSNEEYYEEQIHDIGMFLTLEEAEAVVEKYKRLPGFCQYPEGFTIDVCKVGEDHWIEGFVTVWYDKEN